MWICRFFRAKRQIHFFSSHSYEHCDFFFLCEMNWNYDRMIYDLITLSFLANLFIFCSVVIYFCIVIDMLFPHLTRKGVNLRRNKSLHKKSHKTHTNGRKKVYWLFCCFAQNRFRAKRQIHTTLDISSSKSKWSRINREWHIYLGIQSEHVLLLKSTHKTCFNQTDCILLLIRSAFHCFNCNKKKEFWFWFSPYFRNIEKLNSIIFLIKCETDI